VQSVAQASFDAWVKYYRTDENTPNATISYYTKGALVALCLDLTLRSEGHTSLDEVMRALWVRCNAGPMSEADFAAVLKELGGRPFTREIANWIHGTRELPLAELLRTQGVEVLEEPAQMQQRLGIRATESNGSVVLKNVLRGGAAEQAGMAPNDEWVGLEAAGEAWRITKVDDLLLYAGDQRKMTALVARDRRLLELDLALPPATTWRLVLRDAARAQLWLAAHT
jgi:predicted metalloprotease with PDZ domain